MNHLDTTVRRLRLVLAAAAALGLLVLPSAASAKRHNPVRDRNHDGIPDKWEKRFHLSTKSPGVAKGDPDRDGLTNRGEFLAGTSPRATDTNRNGVTDPNEDPDRDGVRNRNELRERTHPRKVDTNRNGVKDGREDADRDKLNNMGEDQAGTDPMNPDTDGDGVKDGNEEAGRIVSFDGTTLTISLFGGSDLSGTVDADTFIDCGDGTSSDDPTGSGATDDPSVEDPSADDPSVDDPPVDDPSVDEGSDPGVDDGSSEPSGNDESTDPTVDDGSGGGQGCSTDSLKVGAVVEEASVTATPDGAFFDAITLKP